MSDPIRPDNLGELLTAFADGELEPARMRPVLDYLAAHPDAVEQLRAEQRLRAAADRVVRRHTPPFPEGLRRQILAMAGADAGDAASAPARGRRAWWWVPLAAAACVAVGVLADRTLLLRVRPASGTGHATGAGGQTVAGGVPATIVAHAARVHSDCSRLAEGVHGASFPRALGSLAEALRSDLGGPNPYPDLSGIGFAFAGVGPCDAPLKGTVHLLYRSTGAGAARAVSVFVQPYREQFEIRPGTLYLLSSPSSPFPTYAWRTEEVIYILVADDESVATTARQAIAVAPRS